MHIIESHPDRKLKIGDIVRPPATPPVDPKKGTSVGSTFCRHCNIMLKTEASFREHSKAVHSTKADSAAKTN
jgi:hypothetical protein